jgi:hypothetical protein
VFFSTSIENPINDNGGVLQLGWSHDGITWILGANQLCKQQPIDLTVTGMYYYPEAGCLVPISPNSYWLVFSSQTAGQSVGVWEAFTLGRALVSYQDPAPLLSRLQLGTGVAPKASDGEMLDVNGDLSFPRTSSTGRRMLNWRTYPAGTYSYCIGCNNGDGRLYVGSEPGASAPRLIMGTIGGVYYCNFEATDPHFKGSKLWQTEGSNQTMGLATLTAGSVTIATNRVTANSRLYCTSQSGGANSGHLYVSARVAGTSFTVTSSNNADASTFAWLIIEPE